MGIPLNMILGYISQKLTKKVLNLPLFEIDNRLFEIDNFTIDKNG
ncbi:hypothetical protein ACE38W_15950 [Chitinophaga sp. Hz27]